MQKIQTKKKSKEEALINKEKLYNNRNNVNKAFENEVFHLKMDFKKKSQICMIKHYQIESNSKC